jgi:sodium/potassium-transporting ATPase subunit alpha
LVKKLEVDAHYVDLKELCRRFNTNLEKGMTAEAVVESRKKYGLNKIKTAKKKPTWVKFLNSLFGGFTLFLWLGSFLCFLAFALRASAYENTPNDNLYLGIALVGVAVITGLLSFYEERKSSKIMSSFKTLLPQTVVTLRDGIKSNIKAELLVPGDIIEVFDGDIIPGVNFINIFIKPISYNSALRAFYLMTVWL